MLGFLYPRVRQTVAQTTYFLSTLELRLRNFIHHHFKESIIELVPSSIDFDESLELHYAVVALYPRPALLPSVLRLIGALESDGYRVIVVMNQSPLSKVWWDSLIHPKRTMILRRNIGRDFGAYKEGLLYLLKSKQFSKVSKIALANDSVFYGERSSLMVSEILGRKVIWNSMFVNYQYHTHSQSFFQVFDKEIFSKAYFQKFWFDYYPSDLRHHAINRGEVKLSSILIEHGFTPSPFVTAGRILESDKFDGFTIDENFGLWSNLGMALYDPQMNNPENSILRLKRTFLENNPTHHAGLVASRILGAPLKLDILQTGQVSPDAIEMTLNNLGCGQDEIHQVLLSMTQKGTHVSVKGFQRLWKNYGYV